MSNICWKKVPTKQVPPRACGRVIKAYQHTSGAMLLHWTPCSRNATMARRTGAWLLEHQNQPIRMRRHYGRIMPRPPLDWATTMLRGWLGKDYSRLCGKNPRYHSKPDVKIVPIHPMEGPLAMPPLAVGGPPVTLPWNPLYPTPPITFPSRPKTKLVTGILAKHVLFCDEYDLYVDLWERLVKENPHYTSPGKRRDLEIICMETVLQFRLLELIKGRFDSRFTRLYHASSWRMQHARERLGATRRAKLIAAGILEA